MDRERFEHLLDAYGADFRRWPEAERGEAERFAAAHPGAADALRQARVLDAALDLTREEPREHELLARRILAAAPKPRVFEWRAALALAACAAFGVVLGYGGGLLAPPADAGDDAYFAMAFEAPFEAAAPGDEG